MASTEKRWMHVTALRIGAISFDDAMSHAGRAEATPVGSNSEKDSHANRFLQGVQLTRSASFRVYDKAGAILLEQTRLGKGCGLSITTPIATESAAACHYTLTATSPYAFIASIDYTDDHDVEHVAEIAVIDKSPDGEEFGLVWAAAGP